MKKKEWKQRCAELEDHVIEVVAQARSWRKKYLSAIRTTGSLKKDILNKHIQCSNLADQVAELREAAEFEARVAAILAGRFFRLQNCSTLCPWSKMDPQDAHHCIYARKGLSFCAMRAARCAVEEEMDNER